LWKVFVVFLVFVVLVVFVYFRHAALPPAGAALFLSFFTSRTRMHGQPLLPLLPQNESSQWTVNSLL
jgi:hypothetical protein